MKILSCQTNPRIEYTFGSKLKPDHEISFFIDVYGFFCCRMLTNRYDNLWVCKWKYLQAEIPALFLGGDMSWKIYLRKNLRQQNTSGTVTVAFTVDIQGNCSDVEVIKSANPDLDAETLRFIKKSSGYWLAAVQKGRHVRYRRSIDIEFQ
jgi:TonB family protein